ncbi:MAG: Orotate phosphoribosyltransferase [Chlamydiales bacterium]|nr:Orotate phosphoribosyltransferase [Chlamydiales bacterium]MCH9636189.1 Orotate phosphoribosyltransferase [Chlamydiales bacterium]MCH9704105.1 orotate phosphoribosyltransferase [Chlamydiota bacterium]
MIQEFVFELEKIGAVKRGDFVLKSGAKSKIYIDLRLTVSSPKLLRMITDLIWQQIEDRSFDLVCGVPYTALPFATTLSLDHNIPMIMRRKEVKSYGTKKKIEGIFQSGQNCLVVEDLITSGQSVMETIEPLEEVGLKVTDVVAFLDREAGGCEMLEERGYRVHTLITLSEMLQTLESHAQL